ncbi:MAG: hypothetical protein JWM10_441 [Myxococcaceae bacterium]|nr:hypothetical protein [Myxococcaceae bacterium]
MSDRARRLALVGAVLLCAYAWFYQGGGWNQNSRFALTRALAEDASVRLDRTGRYEGRDVTGDRVQRGRHLFTDKAPGASIVAAPAVAVARLVLPGRSDDRPRLATLSWVATVAAAGVPTALAAMLLLLVAEALGASRRAALVVALTYGLATPAWCQATLLFGHALSSACLWAAFAAAVALRSDGGPARDRALGWGVGLGAGWAVVTEFPAAVPAAIVAGYALWQADTAPRRWALGWRIAAGALACAAVLGAYDLAAFGSPFALGYGNVRGFAGMQQGVMGVTFPKPEVLFEILLGRYRGLLPLAPALALAPVGLWRLARDPATRGAGIAAAAVAGWYVLFNSAYFYWDGGFSFGPRHMLPSLPFLALGLAPLWTSASQLTRRALAVLTAAGFVACLVGVSVNAQPPEGVRAPMSALLWPAFAAGDLALNRQSIVDAGLSARRDPAVHASNLGERLGLRGHASLAPLALLWAVAAAAYLRGRAPEAPAETPAEEPRRARVRRSRGVR